jgi:RNA 3'-terminal phosphate cyclase
VTIHSLLAQGSVDGAQRQSERARKRLRESGIAAEAQNLPLSGRSRGMACVIAATFEGSRVCFSAVGTSTTPVEEVADRAVARFLEFMARRGAVDERAAETLVIPLSLLAGGVAGKAQSGRFTTSEISPNLRCQLTLAQRFLPIRAVVRGDPGGEGEVILAPPPAVLES